MRFIHFFDFEVQFHRQRSDIVCGLLFFSIYREEDQYGPYNVVQLWLGYLQKAYERKKIWSIATSTVSGLTVNWVWNFNTMFGFDFSAQESTVHFSKHLCTRAKRCTYCTHQTHCRVYNARIAYAFKVLAAVRSLPLHSVGPRFAREWCPLATVLCFHTFSLRSKEYYDNRSAQSSWLIAHCYRLVSLWVTVKNPNVNCMGLLCNAMRCVTQRSTRSLDVVTGTCIWKQWLRTVAGWKDVTKEHIVLVCYAW